MRLSETQRQAVVFVGVGLAATATHLGVALLANGLFGAPPLVCNFVGYSSAVALSYLGHAVFTFRKRIFEGGQFLRFVVVSLLALGVSQGLVWFCTSGLHWPLYLAMIPVALLVPAFTFTLAKLWAFVRAAPPETRARARRLLSESTKV
ncbi:MAG: GtrA family protein [Caulobacterales bacterium]|nr:GtrA family protein [Caulobacterales bacterium]